VPQVSQLAKSLAGQKMFQIMEHARALEATGREILHLEIGDPDFNSPSVALEACKAALDRGDTHYTSSTGLLELRTLGATLTERSRGFLPKPEQVVVTAGANIQIYYVAACVVNSGDEVIIFDPSFVSYEGIIRIVGGVAVKVPLRESNGFIPDIADLETRITNRTRLVIVNSPHNPTGAVFPAEIMRGIYELCVRYDLVLLSDEVYGRMVYPDARNKFSSPSVYDHCSERVVICHSLSKSYAMTGWRIGALTAPVALAKKVSLLLETTSSCIPPFIQQGAIAALKDGNLFAKKMMTEYRDRRDILVNALNNLPNVSCSRPDGTFYAFANISKSGLSSEEFSDSLLQNCGIASCPGVYFGPGGENYVRFCFAQSVEVIEKAANLLSGFNDTNSRRLSKRLIR
jgi:aspartate aminotransferase